MTVPIEFEPASDGFDQSIQPIVSIAISLKRIADALAAANANTPQNPCDEYGRAI